MNAFVKKSAIISLFALLAILAGTVRAGVNPGLLPLFFEPMHDQSGAFIARGHDSEFSISGAGADFVLRQASGQTTPVHMEFVGAQTAHHVYGADELAGKVNYFTGNKPADWHAGVTTYGQVHIDDIYPGVNVTYYGNEQRMEYDLDLAAGISPATIAIRFTGAKKLSVNSQGELEIDLNGGKIFQHRPVAYQTIGNARHDVQAAYHIIDANTITFALGDFNHGQPLVIDPILGFSTFFGGNHGETGYAIALDSAGYIYVAGQTLSSVVSNAVTGHFPTLYLATPGAFQTNFAGGGFLGDAFVAKFYPNGTNFVYFTYLGGSQDDTAMGLAVDASGNAYVAGYTDSPDFPVTNAIYTNIAGPKFAANYLTDVFVTELNTNGSKLVYSTYLGGNAVDYADAITVDPATGTAYVVGATSSTNFPVKGSAFQSTLQCTNTYFYNNNAFLAEIAPGGTNLNYCSFFGGTNEDEATSIALDSAKNIYIAGFTYSTNFPITNYLAGSKLLNGYTNKLQQSDAFAAKFTPDFGSLVYSTFLGGSNNDVATGIAVDPSQNAYVVGWTASTNFPITTNGLRLFSAVRTNTFNYPIETNAFLTKLVWDGTTLSNAYSQEFGGNGIDVASGVALDPSNNVYLVGSASSTNYPVTPVSLFGGLRTTNSSIDNFGFYSDVVVTAFKSDLSGLLYSGYIGGSAADYGYAIAVDSSGNAYITGQTLSTNFPTYNPAFTNWTTLNGTNDAFLTKIVNGLTNVVTLSIQRSGTNALVNVLNAPTVGLINASDFAPLLTTTNLRSTNWLVISNAPVFTNGIYTFTVPLIQTNRAQFFRLPK